eukprot:1184137-Prorocentrum_minimum.AAC.1
MAALLTTRLSGACCGRGQAMIGGVGDDGKTSVTVAARDKLTVVHVVEVGDVAAWEVEVEDHSIELSVTLKRWRTTAKSSPSHG